MTLLNEFLKKNDRVSIAVMGDAMVDEYFYTKVKKISPEFPIPVVQTLNSKPDYALPGGAANVAYQMRHFNVDCKLYSLIDSYSLDVFKKAGLDISKCVEMVYGYGNVPYKRRFYTKDFPMIRWDIEQPEYGLDFDHLFRYLQDLFTYPDPFCNIIIFSDYDKGVFNSNYHKWFLNNAFKTIVDPKGKNLEKWYGCTVFKPNSVEAEELSGFKDWKQQCLYFKKRIKCESVVITQEGDGVVGIVGEEFFEYRPKSDKIVRAESTIGAGDCFVAFLAMAIGQGFNVIQAAEIAFQAGALYVQRKHNEPITPRQLRLKDDPIAAKFAPLEEINEFPGKLVMTNGVFDLLHPGHIHTLKFAKSKGDRLVVAVNSDESVAMLKPGRPYMNLCDRMYALACLEMVDYVVSFEEKTPLNLIEKLNPDVLVKGAEYRIQDVVGHEIVKEVCVSPMLEGYSTTELLKKIREG